jgi:hypothetical protein
MLRTYEATLHPNGMLSFRNDVSLRGTYRVLVTILDEAEASAEPQAADTLTLGDVRRTLQLLRSPAYQRRAYGSVAKMDMVIRENRDGWDD